MTNIKQLITTLVALFAMTTGAWADKGTLLTTINASSDFTNGSKTFDNIVTVTLDEVDYSANDGWNKSSSPHTVSVAPVDGVTVTGYVLYFSATNPCEVEASSFTAYLINDGVYADTGMNNDLGSVGITKIEVYGPAAPAGTALNPDATRKVWTLDAMPAGNVELQVEYYPAMLTLAASPADGGKVELDAAAAPVEWTPETWTNVSTQGQHDALTSGDITLSTTDGWLTKASDGNLTLYSADNEYDHQTLTFSTTGDGFTRIELTMTSDASNHNPHITPADGWTFSGKSAVWEGEATKSLVCQNCTTTVSKITFYRGSGLPTGVEKDETGNIYVKSGTTVTLKATPAEGYKFLYWEDDQTKTNPVREVTIESGMADMTYKAVFAEPTFNVTFVEGTNLNEWTATPNTEVKKDTKVDIKYNGTKKVIGVKVEKVTYAEGHALTSAKFGEIVCSDGKAYAAADKDILPRGVKAEALVCYVDGEHGLALAMADVKNEKMSWDNDRGANDGKTAAEWCDGWNTSHPIAGAKWLLASQTQWDKMISAAGGASNLSNAFSAVGGTNLQAWSYWSSTPNHGGSAAYMYYFPSSSWQWTYLTQDNTGNYIRACLEW